MRKGKAGRPKKNWSKKRERPGRPPAHDPKKNRIELRLDDHDLRMIELLSKRTGYTKSEVVRLCLWLEFHEDDRINRITELHERLQHRHIDTFGEEV